MQRGLNLFYIGLGIAAAGLTPIFMGTSKGAAIGVPMVAGGGALAFYGRKKKREAESRPSTALGVTPLRGVA
jgi:hypothetical protein